MTSATSWSFSRFKDFNDCPRKFKSKYIDKMVSETPGAAARGTLIHSEIEAFLQKKTEEYPSVGFKEEMAEIRELNPVVEQQWGLDQNWAKTDWSSAWLRLILDFYLIDETGRFTVNDLKTGQKYITSHVQQGQLYAIAAKQLFPDITSLSVVFWYVDLNEKLQFNVPLKTIDTLKKEWDTRGREITEATEFPALPSKWNCRFCPFLACVSRVK